MKRAVCVLTVTTMISPLLGMELPSVGLLGGPVLSTQWSPADREYAGADVSTRSLWKSQAGLYAEWPLNRVFGIRAEIRHSRRGAAHTIEIPDFLFPVIKAKYAYDYLEVPVLLKTVPFGWKPVRPYLTGGLYAGRLTGKPEYTVTLPGLARFTEPMKELGEWDWGFTSGYGVEWLAGPVRMGVEYRFCMGFTELSLPTGPGFPEVELQNMSHALGFEVGMR